jgi:hypothetical protein
MDTHTCQEMMSSKFRMVLNSGEGGKERNKKLAEGFNCVCNVLLKNIYSKIRFEEDMLVSIRKFIIFFHMYKIFYRTKKKRTKS